MIRWDEGSPQAAIFPRGTLNGRNCILDQKNSQFKDFYLDAVDEIKSKIIISRQDFNKFDEIFGHLYDLIHAECSEEISEKRLITIFLHYMYWNCDIGKKVSKND